MNTDGTGFNNCKECHKTGSLWNHTTTDHKEGEQLEDRRNVGESSCNFEQGTDQTVQSLMFMMMMMMKMMTCGSCKWSLSVRFSEKNFQVFFYPTRATCPAKLIFICLITVLLKVLTRSSNREAPHFVIFYSPPFLSLSPNIHCVCIAKYSDRKLCT